MQDLTGEIAVVTGGGSGIGRELVCQLAAAGCHVAACDLSMEGLEATRAACADSDVNISLHTCNVSNESQVQAFAAEVLEEAGFDDLEYLLELDDAALADVAATVGMKPGHAHKLQRWLREKAAAVAVDA